MKNILAMFVMAFLFARPASAVEVNGNNYVEYCVGGGQSCVVGVYDKYGNFGVLVREGAKLGDMLLGDVWKMSPSGDWVARIRETYYQQLVAAGIERVDFDPSASSREIAQLDREIQKNANKCLWMLAGCTAGGAAAVGGGWYGIGAAVIACAIVAWDCDDLHDTNKLLLEQRRKLQEEMDAEIEKENGVEDDDKEKGSGGGGGTTAPAAGGQGGWFGPGTKGPSRGTVTITQALPGPMPGSGGAPHPAHLH